MSLVKFFNWSRSFFRYSSCFLICAYFLFNGIELHKLMNETEDRKPLSVISEDKEALRIEKFKGNQQYAMYSINGTGSAIAITSIHYY